jgi:hypothetical protein
LLRLLLISGLIIFFLPVNPGEDYCNLRNSAFKEGEKVTYKIYYTLAGMYVESGEVIFSCNLEKLNNIPVYHLVATGKTLPFYDHFYKVRDRYESYTDTESLKPYQFSRDVYEGSTKKYENIRFNQVSHSVITDKGVYKVSTCIHDVLSAMYYLRNIDFTNIKTGDKIPFSMFLDNQVYPSYVRYLGKEIVKTKYGKFHSIKFKPLLIKGTLFAEGEKMTVWVSDDVNHLPLRVESAIVVGSVKADMMDYKNLRTPLSSEIH